MISKEGNGISFRLVIAQFPLALLTFSLYLCIQITCVHASLFEQLRCTLTFPLRF